MSKYKDQTIEELIELMKSRDGLPEDESKELERAYREAFTKYIEDSKAKQARILAILGPHYSSNLSN